MADGCNCQIVYDVVRCDIRELASTGAQVPGLDWIKSDSVISFDLSAEIEAGKKDVLRCGGIIKNTMQTPDSLTGATVKLDFCCQNAEVQYVIEGACGMVVYDSSSPPCAIGYNTPTPAQQALARPFEMRLYMKEISGSSTIGYKEIHFYYCLPSFLEEKGDQEAYATPTYSIKAQDNPNYGTVKGVSEWRMLVAMP